MKVTARILALLAAFGQRLRRHKPCLISITSLSLSRKTARRTIYLGAPQQQQNVRSQRTRSSRGWISKTEAP